VRIEIEGVESVRAALDGVRDSMVRKILRKSVGYAMKPLVPAVRVAAPSRFGTLKRSIISRLKGYRKAVVAVVGPASKFKETVRQPMPGNGKAVTRVNQPARTAHLVESGTKKHFIPAPGFGRKRTLSKSQFGLKSTPGWEHPGAKARPFIGPTADTMKPTVLKRMTEQVLRLVKVEYERAVSKGTKFWSTD
jgi:HK97 gp10 family phage protein